ncbi:MAG TPA: tetratricopeptide repeat protein [Flavitalea sp.]|nr:tetratricopeptide repeat protein [Flavitalea sp.]
MQKIIVLFVCFLAAISYAHAQKPPAKKQPPKTDQSMEETMKELRKQMESMSPEDRKMMEATGMFDLLKQVETTTREADKLGVDIQAEAATDPQKIPAKPSGLPIPTTPANKEQLKTYLQPLMQRTNAAIKPDHKAEITKHLNKGKETGEIAMAYLINREMDKALYLLLNACLTDTEDYASLNNLGAFMTMSGYAHQSLPILQYVQKQFPQTPPTLLNNIGQAWLSLGHLDKADKFLKDALKKDSAQTQASYSLAVVAKHQGNTAKCVDYVKQTIENGGVTGDVLSLLPNEGLSGNGLGEIIRAKYKPYYKKDHAITKRFRAPAVPGSYEQVIAAYDEIETFFQDMDHTSGEASTTAAKLTEEFEQQKIKLIQAQNLDLANMMKTPGDQGALLRHHFKYNHPLKLQSIIFRGGSDYSTSFEARMRREDEKRVESEKQLRGSLAGIQKSINKLHEEANKLEGGEKGDEELKRTELLDRACALSWDYQMQLLAGQQAIGNLYVQNMEDLLNQQLQEEIFWRLVESYPADPTASAYQAYASYLAGIYSLRKAYPDVYELRQPCKQDPERFPQITGKMQQWEADHCNISWGMDVKVFKGKFDCKGMKMELSYGPLDVGYGVTQNPVNGEISSHTISVDVGAGKSFDVGKTVIKGKVGASAGGSVTIDRTGHISDITARGSAGAGIGGPIGSAGVGLGSVEVSMSGGFNSSGPSVKSPISSFLSGK